MREFPLFQIECVEGGAATIYVCDRLRPDECVALRRACAWLPPTVRVLRIHLSDVRAREESTVRELGRIIRDWRAERGEVRVILAAGAASVPSPVRGRPARDGMFLAQSAVAAPLASLF